jgi:hypothetical protein
MSHPWKACLVPVPQQGRNAPDAPSVSFLERVLAVCLSLSDDVFAENDNYDIYSVLSPKLGPFEPTDILKRRAAMCEACRVTAAYESDYNTQEGADTTAGPETLSEEETGAWQVSENSIYLDKTGNLKTRVIQVCNLPQNVSNSALEMAFISVMKSNPNFAIEYVMRLFRVNTKWSGPTDRNWTYVAATPEAVAEWQQFLTNN